VLSLEEISDRLELQQLLVNYSTAIDTRRFDDLDRVFTADAYIDYRAMGGIDGSFPEVKAWLAEVLPNFPAYSHLIGNFDVAITGAVLRALVRRRVRPHTRRLADDPARRDQALRPGRLSGIFLRGAWSGTMVGCLLRDTVRFARCAVQRSHT
jgi:SnoaL-like domain